MASKRRRTSRSSRRTSRGGPLKEALQSFFTNTVPLPTCPRGTATGSIWWELRDGWKYPWRIVKFTRGVAQGYPCGEPVIATAAAVRKPYGNTAPRAVPVKAVATNKGMLKGYWKVAIVDAEGHENRGGGARAVKASRTGLGRRDERAWLVHDRDQRLPLRAAVRTPFAAQLNARAAALRRDEAPVHGSQHPRHGAHELLVETSGRQPLGLALLVEVRHHLGRLFTPPKRGRGARRLRRELRRDRRPPLDTMTTHATSSPQQASKHRRLRSGHCAVAQHPEAVGEVEFELDVQAVQSHPLSPGVHDRSRRGRLRLAGARSRS